MKRHLISLAASGLAVGLFAGSANAAAGLIGSAHDFSKTAMLTWNSSGELCLPCHIPHLSSVGSTTYLAGVGQTDSYSNLLGAPLWNHSISTYDTANYKLFSSWTTTSTIVSGVTTSASTAVVTQQGQVDQNTKLCLGCHDGTVALNNFTQPHDDPTQISPTNNPVYMTTVASWAVKGAAGDLTATHPIGAAAVWPYGSPNYSSNWVDPSVRDAKGIMPLQPLAASNQLSVGCSSCHDVHNTAGNTDFLWIVNSGSAATAQGVTVPGSALCLSCHIK